MNKYFVIILILAIAIGGVVVFTQSSIIKKKQKVEIPTKQLQKENIGKNENTGNMKISSPAFQHNSRIPSKYTCDGENISPSLTFQDVPENAKSLVLIVDDPDAPSKTWVHWVVYNIDPSVREVAEDSVPKGGIDGMTDFGRPGYGGPCPPSGTHRYFFKLYALDSILDLPSNSDKKAVEGAMEGHIIEQAELIGLYSRE